MLETVDLPDIELFATGTWNGQDYTAQDLDDMAAAYQTLKDAHGYVPVIKLDHADQQPQLSDVPVGGGPAFGYIENVRRTGEKLYGDFKKVPKKLADLMEAGAYRGRSAEVWWDLEVDGKPLRRALKAVALLGVVMPAVSNLKDVFKLYQGQHAFGKDDQGRFHVALMEMLHDVTRLQKLEVQYRMEGQAGRRCGTCRWYAQWDEDAAGSCTLVDGSIDPMGICDRFEEQPMKQEYEQGLFQRFAAWLRGGQPDGEHGHVVPKEDPDMAEITVQQFEEFKASQAVKFAELEGKVHTLGEENAGLKTENATLKKYQLERWASDTVRHWYGDIDSNHKRLIAYADKFGMESAEVREYIEREDGIATAMQKGGLFRELGANGEGHASAQNELEAALKKYTDAGKTKAQAIKLLAQEHPRLYEAHRAAVTATPAGGN